MCSRRAVSSAPPGSVYDNDTVDADRRRRLEDALRATTSRASRATKPATRSQIPAVSSDGSHILMAAGGTGPCGCSTCPTPPCGAVTASPSVARCSRATSTCGSTARSPTTSRRGHDVDYVGDDRRRLEGLLHLRRTAHPGRHRHAASTSTCGARQTDSLDAGLEPETAAPGNSDTCNADFVVKCGVVTYSNTVLLRADERHRRQLPLRQLDRRRERRHLLLLAGAARRLARDARTRRTSTSTGMARPVRHDASAPVPSATQRILRIRDALQRRAGRADAGLARTAITWRSSPPAR